MSDPMQATPVVVFDHLALLVESVTAGRRYFADQGYALGAVEDFPAEGTREVYVGAPHTSGRLLLMEAIGEGPYQRAMAARGPGLHHIGIAVPDLETYVLGLPRSTWYLHPQCLPDLRTGRQAWLARPGTPLLIEVFQATADALPERLPVCTTLEIAAETVPPRLVRALGCDAVVSSADDDTWLTMATAVIA